MARGRLASKVGAAVAVFVFGVPFGLLFLAGPAQAGGGCHEPVSTARGARVEMRQLCFTPTVLYVQPGETVTWTNADELAHVLAGSTATWGRFEEVLPNESFSFRFLAPGVYPYACFLHAGMNGAVVVGSPKAPAKATTAVEGIAPVFTLSSPPPVPSRVEAESSGVGSGWRTAAIAGFALLALTAGALTTRALRRKREDLAEE